MKRYLSIIPPTVFLVLAVVLCLSVHDFQTVEPGQVWVYPSEQKDPFTTQPTDTKRLGYVSSQEQGWFKAGARRVK